jgi:2-polyprenyl-3-methyl-5-hydroxy-6-metoxy-1,4-benzoquinol methylase
MQQNDPRPGCSGSLVDNPVTPQIRSGPMHFFRLALVENLLKNTLRQGTVLDAGCGDGSLSIRLARKGFFVYAVDAAKEWCDTLRSRLTSLDLKDKIKVFCSPLEKFDFNPGFFDAVVCGEVLEHIDNDVEILNKFYSLLKEKGNLILSVPLVNKGWGMDDAMAGHMRLYDLRDLISILEGVGFKVDKVLGWGFPFTKLYHKFIFLAWANMAKSEDEIRKPKHLMTRVGKSNLVSVILGFIFFIDILFTPPAKGIGVILRAKKV